MKPKRKKGREANKLNRILRLYLLMMIIM